MESYQLLEREFAEWNQLPAEGMVACSSGTAALHLALESLRLPPGSHVIVPDYTMVACARAVTLAGHTPVFVDCCSDNLLIDIAKVRRLLDRTASLSARSPIRALIAVHNYGRRVDMALLRKVCEFYQVAIVEDLAEAHGIGPDVTSAAACWSFYRNKIVAGEEGGAVWFRDSSHAALARQLRTLGFTDAHDYTHVPRGHNYRLANALADIVLRSLRHVNYNSHQRRLIEQRYDEICPEEWRQPARDVVWVYDFWVKGMTAEQQRCAVEMLRCEDIQARYGFKPLSSLDEYRRDAPIGMVPDNPCALAASREVIYLPVQPGMTNEDDMYCAFDIVRRVIGK